MKRLWCVSLMGVFVLTAVLDVGRSASAQNYAPAQSPTAKLDASAAQRYFSDVILINQHGDKLRFYSDLLKDKVVVISTFFTSCQGSCPVTAGTFLKLQQRLGERLGKDVHLISVSVDPHTDTPAKLKAYAERFQAKPGWHLLSGTKENVDSVLARIGQAAKTPEAHSNIIIVGNETTGLWKKAFGLSKPEKIIQIVDSVLKDQG